MDKRIILLIIIVFCGSLSFAMYRKMYFKHEGIRFTISPRTVIKTTDSIVYNDQTSDASRWKWDFGDGEFSGEQSGKHTYFTPGQYKVRLTVYGGFGTRTDSSRTVDVLPGDNMAAAAPAVDNTIAGPTAPQVGKAAAYDATVPAASYEWKVENDPDLMGKSQKNKSASFQFKSAGTRTLVLTMHNPDRIVRKDINVKDADAAPVVVKEKSLPPPPTVPAQASATPKAHHQQAPKAPQSHGKSSLPDLGEGVEYEKGK